MATRWVEVTPAPTAIPELTDNQGYTVQNVSPDATVRVALAKSTPSRGGPAFNLVPGELATATPATGESVYVWTETATARLALDEAH